MQEIESESQFIWRLTVQLFKLPFRLILVLLGKRKIGSLFEPFVYSAKFAVAPKCTTLLIFLNCIVFVISLLFPLDFFVHAPSDLFSLRAYTLFTTGFIHASLAHLAANMAGLFIIGRVVEKKIGALKTFLVYTGALLISTLFSSLIHLFLMGDNRAGIGASGALMGLVAAAILLEPFYVTYKFFIPLPIIFVGWVAVFADISGIINPAEDGIGHFAHIGGFLSITLLTYFLSRQERQKLKKGLYMNLLTLAVGVLVYFFVTLGK